LIKAVEMLGGGGSVTQTALDLGYGSPSAFIYAFRQEMGTSPQAYCRRQPAFRRKADDQPSRDPAVKISA
jgi:AraC-like DNA-binding protein